MEQKEQHEPRRYKVAVDCKVERLDIVTLATATVMMTADFPEPLLKNGKPVVRRRLDKKTGQFIEEPVFTSVTRKVFEEVVKGPASRTHGDRENPSIGALLSVGRALGKAAQRLTARGNGLVNHADHAREVQSKQGKLTPDEIKSRITQSQIRKLTKRSKKIPVGAAVR